MKHYTVVKAITLQAGVIALSEAQAKDRLHNLKRLMGKGRYEIVKPVEFKIGEVLGLEGGRMKQYAGWLEAVEEKERN